MEYLLYLGALALIAVGLAGTVIPAIPGLPIIFAGSWLIGWASGYELISVTAVVILALLAAVGIGIDILAQILGAKRAGASRAGLWGAVIGTVVGLVTGIWGIVFFPLIGAVIGEIMAGRDMLKAGTVGLATWIGMAVGIGVKIALAFIMVGIVLFSIVTNSGITSFFGAQARLPPLPPWSRRRRMGQRPLKAIRDSLLSEAGSWKCRRVRGRRVLTTLRLPLWMPLRRTPRLRLPRLRLPRLRLPRRLMTSRR